MLCPPNDMLIALEILEKACEHTRIIIIFFFFYLRQQTLFPW